MIEPLDVAELRRDNAELRARNEQLARLAGDANLALEAFARGEVDAVAIGPMGTPVLLHAAQEQLRDHRQLLRAIFDSVMDAIMLADDDGVYVDVNPAACTLFGLAREDLVGRRFSDFVPPGVDGDAGFRQLLAVGHASGMFPLHRLDGTTATLDFNGVANVVPGRHLTILRDVTERVVAEDALRRNEALFRAVIEKSNEVISLTAIDGVTRYLTPAAWHLLGWSPEEAGDRTLREQVIPEDRERIANELARLVRTGERDMEMEIRVRHRDGSIRWLETTGTNLLDDPDVRAIVGHYRDITARKLADAALHESRDELEQAQTLAHLGGWSTGVGYEDPITWSSECYRMFGIPPGTPVTKALFFARMHPDDRQIMQHAIAELLASGRPQDVEHRVRWPDGTVRWIHSRALAARDAGQQAMRMHGTVQDVTERHRAGAALQESQEQYRRIVENTSEGIWLYNARSVTSYMNECLARSLGYTVEEAVGQPVDIFLHAAEKAEARAAIDRRRHGIAERYELKLRRKDGTDLWTSLQANPVYAADGTFDGGIVLVTDMTMRRAADEVRARLAAIVESSDDAIVSVDGRGIIATWNRRAESLYQYRADERIGHTVASLFPEASRDAEQRAYDQAARGDASEAYDTTHLRKDGSLVEVAVRFSPVRDVNGVVIATALLARDLTVARASEATHRRTEELFRQAQKMEAVGRLAGGVAHDFNNLLSVILSYSQFAIEDLKPGDPLRDDMIQIDEAGRRATDLTRQLLAFSRQQVLQPRVLDLNHVLAPMERMLRRLLGEDIAMVLLMAPMLGHVVADSGQLEQVMMNLAVNARDAMPLGGSLAIETTNVHFDVDYVGGPASVTPGDYVLLAVSDTGVGMDAATCEQVFEPFFTTKGIGKGTGLGLSTVFGIVRQSGGHIGVYSEVGRGTTFKVYFPTTDRPVDRELPDGVSTTVRGTETILLVEDEDQVRTVAATILRRHGYHVLETSNGGEAFLVSKSFTARIHLLLTDVVMPRMSGRALAEELAPLRPDMHVLFASGYTDDAIIQHGVLESGVAFIQKPFTPAALLRKVRDVLDAASARP